MRAEMNSTKSMKPAGSKLQALNDADAAPAQQSFLSELQRKVADFLGTKLDGQYNTLNVPAGFNYQLTVGQNDYWNPDTLSRLDSLAASANGIETLSESPFSQLYHTILKNTVYKLSSADAKTMNDALAGAQGQQAGMIQTFEGEFGTIKDGDVHSSKCIPPNKVGYIMWYVNTNYKGDITKMPDDFRVAYQQWKNIAAPAVAISQRQTDALARLLAAQANTEKPADANGGLQTDDSTYALAYDGLPATNDIINGLNTDGNQVCISCTLDQFSSNAAQFHVEGSSGFWIPLGFLSFGGRGGASDDLQTFSSHCKSISIALTYKGVTLIHAAPRILSLDNTSGWYDASIIQEVVAKTGKDVTGFQLASSEIDIPSTFGPGKDFARAKTLVLSQAPEVKMVFGQADANWMKETFQEGSSSSFRLFGFIPLGSSSQSYSVTSVEEDSAAGAVTVTFGPVKQQGTVPPQKQTCYIMGGVVQYPPDA